VVTVVVWTEVVVVSSSPQAATTIDSKTNTHAASMRTHFVELEGVAINERFLKAVSRTLRTGRTGHPKASRHPRCYR
jgi:hypothetical protein